jgi:hypothetical protein
MSGLRPLAKRMSALHLDLNNDVLPVEQPHEKEPEQDE